MSRSHRRTSDAAGEATPGCSASDRPDAINGAGATFPYPIYSKWFDEYQKSHPDVRINYQSIGSGGGIKQLTAQTVFFGASDGPMTDAQLQGRARRRSCTFPRSSAASCRSTT